MNSSLLIRLTALSVFFLLSAACDSKQPAAEDAPTAGTPPPGNVQSNPEIPPGQLNGQERKFDELSPEEQKEVMNKIIQARARQQANGLGGGSLTVNKAWNYTGYSYLSPDPNAAIEARLVAVDVTLSGHTPFFDLDDIEIVDAKTFGSFGSDPHAEFLTLDGKLMEPGQVPAPAPKASRWLLIYAFPKNQDEFRLFYWGKQLTAAPEKINPEGWEVPYPAKEEN